MDINLDNITLDNLMEWPLVVKLAIAVILFLAITFVGYQFDIKPGLRRLTQLQHKEQDLKQQLQIRHQQTLRLKQYKKEVAQLKTLTKTLLIQLPEKAQIPDLLESIATSGIDNGLRFTSFDPLKEEYKAFYALLPIRLKVSGTFHQIASFVNRLAKMNRMITFQEFSLQPKSILPNSSESLMGGRKLIMTMLLYTYHRHIPEKSSKQGRLKT